VAESLEPRVIGPGFRDNVYTVVRRIPVGYVSTYGDVGSVLGSPRVARQVGFALAALPEGTDVPWHRVINAKGMVSARGDVERPIEQQVRLEDEGIVFDENGRCPLAAYRYTYDD
jgi:methylated-DNA-protein-cysteine methyltransferase-like protein